MTADSGARGTDRDVHYAKCNGSLCPCYLDGLRDGFADALGVLDAARRHRRVTESLLDYDCWSGNCEHDECVEHPTDVCSECLSFAWDINDEYVPHRALAVNCPILRAVEALPPNDGNGT